MDFHFTPEQEAFREQIRQFLREEVTPEIRRAIEENPEDGSMHKEFSRKVGARGWIGLAWPKGFGGEGIGHIERLIYNEEMIYWRAPVGYHLTGERQMAPSLIISGTPEQQADYIPRIARGELGFCIGYSEPGAGSDLAGLQTRAVADGDDYVINGQKIFTSGAHWADYVWLATRTDPDAPKHKGISVFVVDLKSPGLTVKPLWNMGGGRFNEVYFDDVRVPKRNMVGEENQGWYVVAANLDFERSGIERVISGQLTFDELLDRLRMGGQEGLPKDASPALRHRLADMAVEFQVGRLLAYRVAWLQSQGQVPNYEASTSKVFGTELTQRVGRACIEVLGLYGPVQRGTRSGALDGRIASMYLANVSATIAGGTSEIQRNIIATRGLGLPR